MGYYTDYNLTTENDEKYTEYQMVSALLDINSDLGDPSNTFSFGEIFGWDSLKWYGHEKDLIELSKRFPEVLFTLEGHGEEKEDIWREYYRNGQIQWAPAQIIFDEPTI